MDSFEMNKIAGAVLFTLTMTLSFGILAEIVFHHPKPEKPGYDLASAAPAGGEAGSAGAAPAEEPLGALLAKASVERGQTIFKKCAACHTIDKGGKNGTGPNLYGVVGGPKGHRDDFAYSDAMKARHDKGETWSPDEIFAFIQAPQTFLKGTKMSFAGLPKAQDRADVLDYIHTMADSPVALPTAEAATPAAKGGGEPPKSEAPGASPAPAKTPPPPAPAGGSQTP